MVNPSPYMYFLKDGADAVAGASPEMLVRVEGGAPRCGRSPARVRAAADADGGRARSGRELLADAKERAEHVMLVDLGRNDLGRVCGFESVRVPELMVIERYSHVMHIVSSVTGELAAGHGRARRAAGHVPGGHALGRAQDPGDGDHRRARAGAARPLRRRARLPRPARQPGLLHRHPQLLLPRTARSRCRPGAGIVADSDPPAEQRETEAKAGALLAALQPGGEALTRMLLLIDNYDSFTYNLDQYLGELGARDAGGAQRRDHRGRGAGARGPTAIVISPGPGTPDEAGISLDLIRALRPERAAARRLPRPPGARPGVRRPHRARAAAHARQDVGDPPRRAHRLRGPAPAVHGHALPLAGDRARDACPDCLEVSARTDGRA